MVCQEARVYWVELLEFLGLYGCRYYNFGAPHFVTSQVSHYYYYLLYLPLGAIFLGDRWTDMQT